LVKNDKILLIFDANERSITHMLALYLWQQFYPEYCVDCEYNRNLIPDLDTDLINHKNKQLRKRIFQGKEQVCTDDTDGKTVFPDIIIHKRCSKNNLIAIEVKKTTSQKNSLIYDERKLKEYLESRLNYAYSLFINVKTLSQKERDNVSRDSSEEIGIECLKMKKKTRNVDYKTPKDLKESINKETLEKLCAKSKS